MNFERNKSSIMIIAVLLVVCIGSFFGVSAVTKSDNPAASATTLTPTTQAATTTTAPVHTTVPMATTTTTQVSTSQEETTGLAADITTTGSASNLITTFPGVSSATTTKPTTTEPTTESTTAEYTTTAVAPSTDGTDPEQVIENAAVFDEGFLSYMFNPDGNYYYTNSDPWQRTLGYNEFYDIGAGFVAIYMDTMRCKFEYGDEDWLIQFWKGQYGFLFIGHEIGVYTKPKDREVEHYDAMTENNENALYMSMTGYRDGEELYTRDYGRYWWCTGFVPGKLDNYSDRSELQIKCRITMKDYSMLLGFCGALKENGLVLGEDFTTSGLDVFVTW